MKKKRILDSKLFNSWLKENGRGALERLAVEAGCSASLLQQMASGKYGRAPRIDTIDGMCRVTGLSMDALFPVRKIPEAN